MKYIHPDNKDKPFIDWRSFDKREEGFFMWLDWRLKWSDLDHYMPANTYRDATGVKSPTGAPMTKEQSLWYCLIYGCTYQTEMAWVIYWNFPNFWEIDIDEMQRWNVENLDRQRYARDTKYNKGRIAEQVKSMREVIKPYGTIQNWVESHLDTDENKSFENMFEAAFKIHKYGRMTTWLFTQALHETGGMPIKPNTMLATHESNWSVRSGLCYLYGLDDIIEAKTKQKLSADDMNKVRDAELDVCAKAAERVSFPLFSNFLLESHLCQYKKLMLGGDYGGHSTGDHYSRASWLAERWKGEVNFDAFFEDAMKQYNPVVQRKVESKALRDLCKKTGQLINMHDDYDFLPNMYKETEMNPDWFYTKDNEKRAIEYIDNYKKMLFESKTHLLFS